MTADARASSLRAIARIDTSEAAELLLGVFQHEGQVERTAAAGCTQAFAGHGISRCRPGRHGLAQRLRQEVSSARSSTHARRDVVMCRVTGALLVASVFRLRLRRTAQGPPGDGADPAAVASTLATSSSFAERVAVSQPRLDIDPSKLMTQLSSDEMHRLCTYELGLLGGENRVIHCMKNGEVAPLTAPPLKDCVNHDFSGCDKVSVASHIACTRAISANRCAARPKDCEAIPDRCIW